MNIITSNVQVKLTQEEKNKLQDAREVISHLFDLMYDYEQEYAISNIGEEYSMSQVRDTSNLLAARSRLWRPAFLSIGILHKFFAAILCILTIDFYPVIRYNGYTETRR